MRDGYKCIVIDPPWPERGSGKCKRGADRHYKTIPVVDIPSVILQCGHWTPARDSHLWLWATNNYLPAALYVMATLGYRYVTCATWTKQRNGRPQTGLGQYLRGQTEQLLFGVRGRLPAVSKGTTSIIDERREHSRKPEQARWMIERVSPGPRLEIFARENREGWTCWGDQIGGNNDRS